MRKQPLYYLLVVLLSSPLSVLSADRDEELRAEMWNSSDKDFQRTTIPEKWSGESAVFIAKMHRFEYKKALIAALLRINEYNHFRIKLIDRNAINKYTEISFAADQPGPASSGLKVYAGFKVIKPDGREVIIDLANAVKMEREGSGGRLAYQKIAIPNLEPGDILDYYICEEKVMHSKSHIYFFEPVIYNLPQEYPVIKQKLQFKAYRRCFINLRSLNGAPELKLVVDEENDEQYYNLEDGDREGIGEIRWLYRNRALPTVKFRASYASNVGISSMNVLLGEPGVVKSNVTPQELADLSKSIFGTKQPTKDASRFIKAHHRSEKDPFVISKAAYYYYRNTFLAESERTFLANEELPSYNTLSFTDTFSDFLASRKIPHDIIIGVDRDISGLEDIVIENELRFLVRVKKGDQYLYFTAPDAFTTANYISPRLQGTEAYALDMLSKRLTPAKITLPVFATTENATETTLQLKTSDMTSVDVTVQQSAKGVHKLLAQYQFLDVYDGVDEDNKTFKEVDASWGMIGIAKKKYLASKEAYLAARDARKQERLKKMVESNYDLKITDAGNFHLLKTGRSDDQDIQYSFDFTTTDLIKKTGPTYLVDIGKLIEHQIKIEGDEVDRKHDIYFDYPRMLKFNIHFEIPKGYVVQGLENLNAKVENSNGGFVSTARIEGDKVVIETRKEYKTMTSPQQQWSSVVAFLNAAHTFSSQKLLLKKKK